MILQEIYQKNKLANSSIKSICLRPKLGYNNRKIVPPVFAINAVAKSVMTNRQRCPRSRISIF